ncbi:ATP-binding protein [Cytobacillus purgationiresistens]|uniref:histidine kinase n=1 Tax=Cytobacillus purgationiresistens TaxID=863449 RepID=A0ABU0APW5_9BACI|nr:ATP-binding protein [Cytobacillus purgationiresistens]MDQ0273327.1 two-component system sporulation sensor kinase A [Cytobacillus purgationiresistens]
MGVLSIQEEEYIKFVEQSPDATILLQDGVILYINELGSTLFGAAQKEELIGNGLLEFLSTEYFIEFNRMIETINKGGTVPFYEVTLFRVDGTPFEVEIKGILISIQQKPVIYVILRGVEEKKKTQQFLLQSEKLLIAGQLAAGIVHEVRNPLTAIKGFLQLGQDQFDEKKNKFYIEIIQTEIERIELILTELLTLTRPRDSQMEWNAIPTIIGEVVTLIDTQAIMNNVDIQVIIEDDAPLVYCDKNQLKQVFINLIKNSIEAISTSGHIIIKGTVEKSCLQLLFIDSGPGIPDHLIKRIEEPFFTTKENGTGLGLMVCKQIIESHKGNLSIQSGNNGTTIKILLPIHENHINL